MSRTPSIRVCSHHLRSLSPSSLNRSTPPSTATTTTASFTPSAANAVAAPMAILGAHDSVPPPLPPPSYIPEIAQGHDPGWRFANDPNRSDYGRPAAVKPGSSLLGGATTVTTPALTRHVWPDNDRGDGSGNSPRSTTGIDARRGSSISTVTVTRDYNMSDEGVPPGKMDTSYSWAPSDGRYVPFDC